MTPPNKTTISAATKAAAVTSTHQPSQTSSAPAAERRNSTSLEAESGGAWNSLTTSRELADGFLEYCPRLVAVLLLPLGIKADRAKLLAERRRIGLVEHQTLAGKLLLQRRVELGDVVSLLQTC